jgi:two-component system response regulator FlrC
MSEHIILVVEDDDIQRRQIVRMLQAEGYKVCQASTGDEAVCLLKECRYHLVLTDRKMPGMNGETLLQHIRDNYPGLPVAIITAYPEGIEEFDPDALLVKPYRSDELRELVHHLTERKSA